MGKGGKDKGREEERARKRGWRVVLYPGIASTLFLSSLSRTSLWLLLSLATSNLVGMASSKPSDRPPCADSLDWSREANRCSTEADPLDPLPRGLVIPTCWCDDPCVLKVSTDNSYTRGRRFFMCVNYNRSSVCPHNTYDHPPVCSNSYHSKKSSFIAYD